MPDASAALSAGRLAAESRMLDTCRVTRPGDGAPALDEGTGRYVDPEPVTVYQGPCEFQSPGAGTEYGDVGLVVTDQTEVVKLPVVGSESVRPGHTVTCLTAANDAALVGRVFKIDGLFHKSFATSRRLRCSEVTGG